jgi:hypothetical protein
METIKKASHSIFTGTMNAAKIAKTDAKRIECGRFMGIATGTKSYVHATYGEGVGLIGSFMCVHPETGKAVKTSQLYLPDVALLPLVAAVNAGKTPQFTIDIFAKLDEKAPVGFSYSLEEVIEVENDPLQQMLSRAQGIKPLKLAAPATPAGEAPAPAPASAKSTKGRK